MLKLSIPDIGSVKKFFKSVPTRDVVIDYDEHFNSIKHGDTKLSLSGEDIIPGRITPKIPFPDEWYKIEITDVNPLYEMCSHNTIGDIVEINTRKVQLHTWETKISVTDQNGEQVGDEFKVSLDRNILKVITRIHKKVGEGSMYIKVFKNETVPLVRIYGDTVDYVAYCGKYNRGEPQDGTAK